MSDFQRPREHDADDPAPTGHGAPSRSRRRRARRMLGRLNRRARIGLRRRRRRVRFMKLRVLALLAGLGVLASVSAVFGLMMALVSELPELEPTNENSELVDVNGRSLGLLTGANRRVFVPEAGIAPVMKHAIIAIEDQRFYAHEGVDVRGIGRALYHDIVARRVVQGGSTITQQFVKNALAAHNERTVFNKLREAAVAYHLTRSWPKDRILGNYLNTIYFGNGAYGIESAARTYFGGNHPGCEDNEQRPCAAQLEPHEAALLAGVVASPSGFDPLAHPERARHRRDIVLDKMLEQGYLTAAQHARATAEELPQRPDVQPPQESSRFPYFTSWVRPQVVEALGGGQDGARQAFEGGLRVATTLDAELQEAAEAAVGKHLPGTRGPRAAMVVLDNDTGEVRAMVGGDDYAAQPFNLVTQGQRQPGSVFKPFALAAALEAGISPQSVWSSEKQKLCVGRRAGRCVETFVVNNHEHVYGENGVRTLAQATATSDNAVYAQLGLKVGTGKIARLARRMGVRTPISRNHAITLGGLEQGVTPLDMARSYQAFANGGEVTYGTMSPGAGASGPGGPPPGPAAIRSIRTGSGKLATLPDGSPAVNRERTRRVLEESIADQVERMLERVVRLGTAQRAFLGTEYAAGKTGTTENFGDAWFVGWTERYTVAVWVGYPDRLTPMRTEFAGEPVSGGTYPAMIWKSFMEAAARLHKKRQPPGAREAPRLPPQEIPPAPAPPLELAGPTQPPAAPAPAPASPAAPAPAPAAPEPEPPAPTPPAPEPTPPSPAVPEGTAEGGTTPPDPAAP